MTPTNASRRDQQHELSQSSSVKKQRTLNINNKYENGHDPDHAASAYNDPNVPDNINSKYFHKRNRNSGNDDSLQSNRNAAVKLHQKDVRKSLIAQGINSLDNSGNVTISNNMRRKLIPQDPSTTAMVMT